jgi:hypothetical protein
VKKNKLYIMDADGKKHETQKMKATQKSGQPVAAGSPERADPLLQ